MAIEVQVEKPKFASQRGDDFSYQSRVLYKPDGIPSTFYTNHAQEVAGQFILAEERPTDHNRPFCVVNNIAAAENALHYLATEEAKKRLEDLEAPQIKDNTN